MIKTTNKDTMMMWEKIKDVFKGTTEAEQLKLQMTNLNTNYVNVIDQAKYLYALLEELGEADTVSYLPLAKMFIEDNGEAEDGPASDDGAEVVDNTLPGRGERNAKVAFVSASPSKLDKIRDRPFSGMVGKTLEELYIQPLGLSMKDVYLTNIVKDYLEDEAGNPVEPTDEQIAEALPALVEELKEVAPIAVVALGKTAHKAIDKIAAEWVPHPRAIRIWGNSGEVERKMGRLRKSLEGGDVHLSCEIIKQDTDEKQIVYGVVMEPNENDTDLNWTTAQEIEAAAHYFMKNFRLIDTDHTRIDIEAVPVESWVAPEDTVLGGQSVKAGSWVMGVHIADSAEWEKIKSGEYTGFSIDAWAKIDPSLILA